MTEIDLIVGRFLDFMLQRDDPTARSLISFARKEGYRMLPELDYSATARTEDGVFFRTSDELRRVVTQGNPVYLVLDLPGMLTPVIVCFPAPRVIRVYANTRSGATFFVGETVADEYSKRDLPQVVRYRYGMRLVPWMFIPALPADVPPNQDHLVNYVIVNSDVGFSGALLRVFRSNNGRQKEAEWLEIRQFSTGNDYLFSRGEWRDGSHGQSIVRFVPEGVGSNIEWKPERGWGGYPRKSPSVKLC